MRWGVGGGVRWWVGGGGDGEARSEGEGGEDGDLGSEGRREVSGVVVEVAGLLVPRPDW